MYDQEYDYEYDDDGDYYDDAYNDDNAAYDATAMRTTAAAASGDVEEEGRTMAFKEALELQASLVGEVATLTCLSTDAAALLLGNYLWSKDVAAERYFVDPDGELAKLALDSEAAHRQNTLCPGIAQTQTMCDICCMEYEPDEVFCLSSCQHYFCKECWQDHIKQHVHHNLLSTRCPAQGCREVVGIRNMERLFTSAVDGSTSPVMKDIYREYLSTYVQSSPSLYWCPNPVGCTGIIHVSVAPLQGQGITCDVCKTAYCLRCAGGPHRPATCDSMRDWRKYCSAEGANLAFILVRTKKCPKCQRNIEKSGGCNHMTCKCSYEFCWVCGKEWRLHSGDYFTCKNSAQDTTAVTSTGEQAKSQRFMFHYERYTTHLDSAKRDATFIASYAAAAQNDDGDAEATQKSGRAVDGKPQPSGNALNTVEGITLVGATLTAARVAIAHAYVQMFYMDDKSHEAMLMAHRVGKLEEQTELLSGKIGEYIRLSKTELAPMLDQMHLVDRWRKVVCEA